MYWHGVRRTYETNFGCAPFGTAGLQACRDLCFPDLRMWVRLTRDRLGAVAMLAAVMLPAMMFFSGLTVDLGLALLKKRQLQAATDMAALAAAESVGSASTIVPEMLAINGFSGAQIVSLTTGSYTPNPQVASSQRYVAGGSPTQALALTTSFAVPMQFVSAIVPHASLTVYAKSSGMLLNEAGLVAGSGLASFNSGLANTVLGGALGTQVSLSAVSYQGLANAQINALDFLNGLAVQANVSTGTYGQLLASTVSMRSVVAAAISALNKQGSSQASAVTALQALDEVVSTSPTIALSGLISAGPWSNASIGTIDPNTVLQTSINVFQIITFAAQIANGSNLIQALSATSIPGVATVDLAMTAIEPEQGSYYSLGPVGITVHTSQIRLFLTIHLLAGITIGLVSAPVSLNFYLEVADGTASLQNISCNASPSTDGQVGVLASSGLANAYIGNVSPVSAMTNFSQPVVPSAATILSVANVVTVTGSAEAALQGNAQSLLFTEQQIASLTPQTVSSTNNLSNLLTTLQSSLTLHTTPISLPAVVAAIPPLLAPVFAGLDMVIDETLVTLGVRVGYLDVTVPGDRCGVPALIQ